jgi:O-methyltransferase domain
MMAPYVERAWHELTGAVRTGQTVFPGVHGLGFWDYLAAHPDEGMRFDAAMSGGAERAQTLLTVRDLAALGTLVDIGGGQGRLLAAALAAVPGLRGILFDRPVVLPGAEPVLADAGVRDRCDLVGGNFLAEVPAGGDAYVLASIIHDWPDEQAVAILRACHRAMAPGRGSG